MGVFGPESTSLGSSRAIRFPGTDLKIKALKFVNADIKFLTNFDDRTFSFNFFNVGGCVLKHRNR